MKQPVPQNRKPYPDPQLNCYRVPLTKGRTALIDADDVDAVGCHLWHCQVGPSGRTDVVRQDWQEGEPRRHVILSRVIAGAAAGDRINHRNGNTLDCRSANLRKITRAQQNMNRKKVPGKRSIYKGVSRRPGDKKWLAYIRVDRVLHRLGRFTSEIAAAQAYDRAAVEYFGEFARLNFPDRNHEA